MFSADNFLFRKIKHLFVLPGISSFPKRFLRLSVIRNFLRNPDAYHTVRTTRISNSDKRSADNYRLIVVVHIAKRLMPVKIKLQNPAVTFNTPTAAHFRQETAKTVFCPNVKMSQAAFAVRQCQQATFLFGNFGQRNKVFFLFRRHNEKRI